MEKTKFIRVAVEERRPKIGEGKKYLCKLKGKISLIEQIFWDEKSFISQWENDIEYYFEEIPDREDEMLQMLERSKNEFKMFKSEFGQGSELIEEIESLIQSVKQTK